MNHISDRPIGIFDSGIGGLTVASALRKALPSERLIYLGDTARVPYGTKSSQTVSRFALECSLFLLEQRVKLIVVACNTASAIALGRLQEILRVPIIGVIIPGVKAAVDGAASDRIGVIGTPATIDSSSYTNRLREFNPDLKITAKACPMFVPLAEEGRLEGEEVVSIANDYLEVMKVNKVETLILGCTHYPLLKKTIRLVMGEGVDLIDSAEETAKEVKNILLRDSLLNTHGNGDIECFLTDLPRNFAKLGKRFFNDNLTEINCVSLGN